MLLTEKIFILAKMTPMAVVNITIRISGVTALMTLFVYL